MLHTPNLNSDSLPPTQQANNITGDSKVTNAQLLTFLKTHKIKLIDWKIINLPLILKLLLTLTLGLGNISSVIIFHVDVAHIGETLSN